MGSKSAPIDSSIGVAESGGAAVTTRKPLWTRARMIGALKFARFQEEFAATTTVGPPGPDFGTGFAGRIGGFRLLSLCSLVVSV